MGKTVHNELRWPSSPTDASLWWLPPWTETNRLYQFSPGGNKDQLPAPSALQIMFIVELSVIKPITARQIKASVRKLISPQLSPTVNHASDLMWRYDSATDLCLRWQQVVWATFDIIKQWGPCFIQSTCGWLFNRKRKNRRRVEKYAASCRNWPYLKKK